MSYQVFGGPTKAEEFAEYIAVLKELGLPTERDENGRVGVVETREQAQMILEKLERRIRWLSWRIIAIAE